MLVISAPVALLRSSKYSITPAALAALNPGLDCAAFPKPGSAVCIADLLGYCSHTVAIPAGATCADAAAANGLTQVSSSTRPNSPSRRMRGGRSLLAW